MITMKCFVCGKNPFEHQVALYRQSPKGEAGIFACSEHRKKPVDAEVEAITELIRNDFDKKGVK